VNKVGHKMYFNSLIINNKISNQVNLKVNYSSSSSQENKNLIIKGWDLKMSLIIWIYKYHKNKALQMIEQ